MSVVFQAEDAPVASRHEYWQHLMHQMLVPMDLRLTEPGFRGRVVAGDAGAAQIFELSITAGDAVRTPRLIRRSDPGLCKIDVSVAGETLIEQDGRQAMLAPGDFAFVDLSRPARWVNTAPGRVVAVSFPRALLPLRHRDLGTLTGTRVPGTGGPGALISSLARQLPGQLDGMGAAAHRLGGAVLDLLTAVFAARLDRPGDASRDARHRALLLRVHAYIDARLGDPGLTPGRIAAAHHISVRHLYTLFEAQGTSVAEWIRLRRLDRARADLLDPALRARPVSAIAARWGFPNAAHFNRVFRAVHGEPPGEFRARTGNGPAGTVTDR
ncbi:helix-turn-helix domain-containing protein [Actinomadura madurae]|uniref:helix-turn-helix domain-containing protein n=1 Tax=Actinomadura madurae TaxID=1993 RepID=UPI002025F834|nr:helix-turn-helix domain-containing protein [Actinomadura madurae]URN08748.1 helix-turn-helix domain-containing protein [Actinomadura madurae]